VNRTTPPWTATLIWKTDKSLRAASALADLVQQPTRENLLPDPLNPATTKAVAVAVYKAAHATGVAAAMPVTDYEPQMNG
jgi:malic enzyme